MVWFGRSLKSGAVTESTTASASSAGWFPARLRNRWATQVWSPAQQVETNVGMLRSFICVCTICDICLPQPEGLSQTGESRDSADDRWPSEDAPCCWWQRYFQPMEQNTFHSVNNHVCKRPTIVYLMLKFNQQINEQKDDKLSWSCFDWLFTFSLSWVQQFIESC